MKTHGRFHRVVIFTFAALFAAATVVAHPLDAYVTDGLIGWWDGEYNSLVDGVPTNKPDATRWEALRGGGVFESENLQYGEKSVTLMGKWLQTTIADMPQVVATPVTVQIVARCVKSQNLGTNHQLFHTWHGDFGLRTDLKTFVGEMIANARGGCVIRTIALPVSMEQKQIDTFVFNNGSFSLYVNLGEIAVGNPQGSATVKTANNQFSIGSSRDAYCAYEYFSIRVYNRLLSDTEFIRNALVDVSRFDVADCSLAVPSALPPMPITQDSYVQKGLTSQWDGVYNSIVDGMPTHVENPAQWVDIKGAATPFVNEGFYTFHSNRVSVAKRGSSYSVVPWLAESYRPWTLESSCYCSEEHQNAGMDVIVHASSYGGLGWQIVSSVFRLSGSAVTSDKNKRCRIYDGPQASDYPTAVPRTYSLNFQEGFASLALDGQEISIRQGTEDMGVCAPGDREKLILGTTTAAPCVYDFYSVRLYNRPLTLAERRMNHLVDNVRFFGGSLVTNLVISGEPRCVGVVEPNYGAYCACAAGECMGCSAPEAVRGNKLLGYEVQTNGANGTWLPWLSGNESRFYYRQPQSAVKVVWKWKQSGFMLMVY